MDLAADLRLLYAAWPATDVLWLPTAGQGKNGRAIHTRPGTSFQGGEVFMTGHTLRYPASAFPGARQGDRFVIDGETYAVTEPPLPTDDGQEVVAALARSA